MSDAKLSGIAKYCFVFLWNAGEQIRAVGLCHELTGLTLKESREIVERLVATYGANLRKIAREDRELRDRLNKENPSDIPV